MITALRPFARAAIACVPVLVFAPFAAAQVVIPPDVQLVQADPPSTDYFVRGDSNADNSLNIGDPIHILNFLFGGGGPPSCMKAADSNDDGQLDLSDAANLLNFLFVGPNPQLAGQKCGVDLVGDSLSCATFSQCSFEQLNARWYYLQDNGKRCPPGTPCPWITVRSVIDGEPDEVVTDIDAAYFNPPFSSPEAQANFEAVAVAPTGVEPTRDVNGFIEPGPGPAGRTFVILTTAIHASKRSDLYIPSFVLDADPFFPKGGGVDLLLAVRVYNQGRGSTESSFTMEIRQGRTVLATWTEAALDSGQSNRTRKVVHFPASTFGHRVLLTAVADTADVVREGSEDNNSARLALNFPQDCNLAPGGCGDVPDGCEIEIINGKPHRICP